MTNQDALNSSVTPDQQRLLDIMLDITIDPLKRVESGREINKVGDPRPGVGLRPDGLPHILWCEVPDGEFVTEGIGPNGIIQREIHVPTFYISKYLVTYQQFQAFTLVADGYKNPAWWQGLHPNSLMQQKKGKGDQRWKYNNHPREEVSWWDTVAFCRWLSAKLGYKIVLPTDHQWEKAARGTDERLFAYGNTFDLTKANGQETGINQTSAVGVFLADSSPYDVLDMTGNVCEWTFTESDSGFSNRLDNNEPRSVRGGSWCFPMTVNTITRRLGRYPGKRSPIFGFRVSTSNPPLSEIQNQRTALLLNIQTDLSNPDPVARATAYQVLGRLDTDSRPGVGLLANGLPDILWCEVPGGSFTYGHLRYSEARTLTVPTFYIAKYPITYKQFQSFIDAPDGFKNAQWWAGFHPDGLKQQRSGPQAQMFKYWNHPRDRVSWFDAVAFCRWLCAQYPTMANGQPQIIRLPTEEEWEKAARGPDGYDYSEFVQSGATKSNDPRTNIRQTTAVGIFPDGASPYGAMDMIGNVFQWIFSSADDVSTAHVRTLRGGSWWYGGTATSAIEGHPASRNYWSTGIRIVSSEFPPPLE